MTGFFQGHLAITRKILGILRLHPWIFLFLPLLTSSVIAILKPSFDSIVKDQKFPVVTSFLIITFAVSVLDLIQLHCLEKMARAASSPPTKSSIKLPTYWSTIIGYGVLRFFVMSVAGLFLILPYFIIQFGTLFILQIVVFEAKPASLIKRCLQLAKMNIGPIVKLYVPLMLFYMVLVLIIPIDFLIKKIGLSFAEEELTVALFLTCLSAMSNLIVTLIYLNHRAQAEEPPAALPPALGYAESLPSGS